MSRRVCGLHPSDFVLSISLSWSGQSLQHERLSIALEQHCCSEVYSESETPMNKREFHKKLRHTKGIFCALSFAVIFTLHFSHAVVINFDDRPGFKGTSVQDQPIPASYVVHDEYLPLGVRFDSGGGGIAIVYAINAVSPTNVALATEPGPVLSFNLPVTATFFSNGAPAVVDMVALTLTSSR